MLLTGQTDIDPRTPMPTDRVDDTSVVLDVSAETITWYYLNSGSWASATGQAAGTIVWGKTIYDGILNSSKTAVGGSTDTSVSFGAATRAAQRVNISDGVFSKLETMSPTDQAAMIARSLPTAGDYAVDHRRGRIWVKMKATVANDAISYSVKANTTGGGTGDKVDVIKLGGVSVLLDDAAFGVGTSPVLPSGFLADETATDSVNEGDVGAARITLDRRQINASEYAEDSVFANASYLTLVGAEVDDPTALATMTEGDVGNLKTDLSGRLITTPGTLLAGEFLTEGTGGVLATVDQPVSTSTFATSYDTSAAAESSSVTKASAGNLYGFTATNSSGSARYLQFFNSTTVPADTTVPILSYYIAAGASLHETFARPRYFSTGISWAWSSTAATKTIGSTDGIADVKYM